MSATATVIRSGSAGRSASPALPPEISYYLRQLVAGRFRLVPSEIATPSFRGRPLTFRRAEFQRIRESPQFQETLNRNKTSSILKGWLHVGTNGAPVLFLDGLGGWTLRLPKHGKLFQDLSDLRDPEDMRPYRSHEDPGSVERPTRRRHVIRLKHRPGVFLTIAVICYPSGQVQYEAWIWDVRTKTVIPLYWGEAERVINLFRDLTASWFWVEPPVAVPDDGAGAGAEKHDEGTNGTLCQSEASGSN